MARPEFLLKRHIEVTRRQDTCLGVYWLSVMLLSAYLAWQGKASWSNLLYQLPFLLNIPVSALSVRAKNPFPLELLRVLVMNGTFAFLGCANTDGPLAPYWSFYLVLAIGGAVHLFMMTQNLSWSFAHTVFAMAMMCLANSINPQGVPFERCLFVALGFALAATVVTVIMQQLDLSRDREEEARVQMANVNKMSALGEMAGGLAHEINNPLAIISVSASQMEELLAEKPDNLLTLVEPLAKRIQVTTHRIARIVSGMRAFARNGDQDPLVLCPVNQVIEDALVLCTEKFRSQGIELRVGTLDPAMRISCRPSQVTQVLLNLLNNAVDAIEPYEKKWVAVDVVASGKWIEIWVTDCGLGIPKAVREKLFHPFFTTKEIGKGVGLGLSISKGLIEAQDGVLSVDHRSRNTRFVIRFVRPLPVPSEGRRVA